MMTTLQNEWFLSEVFRQYCNKPNIVNITKRESPDFICTDVHGKFIGLEVTESILETYARMRNIINKYANKGLPIKTIKQQISSFKKDASFFKHGEIMKIGDVTCYLATKGLIDTNIMRLKMTKDIENKTIKLNEKYEIFDKNVLIIAPDGYFLTNNDEHEKVLIKFNTLIRKYKYTFDSIYIYMIDILYCYERKENEYLKNEIMIDSVVIKDIISNLLNK